MVDILWQDPPSVPLFQWLARGSLKQNLLQAIRLWVWLRLLYGTDRLLLPESFTYADWRDAFFNATHPKSDAKPLLHDLQCPCAKTTVAWLFGQSLQMTQQEWQQDLQQIPQQQAIQQQIRIFEQSLDRHGALPPEFKTWLEETRLFGVTGRTLRNDLKALVEIHWLKQVDQHYSRVQEFPTCPVAAPEASELPQGAFANSSLECFTQPDLAAIAHNLSDEINGYQRFFVHLEYVVPTQKIDQVDDWQHQLRQIWHRECIPPVQIAYCGAGQTDSCSVVVYPVCLYYYQRGPYLCAYGETPQRGSTSLDWRNYRLDRIEALTPLAWDDDRVPEALKQMQTRNTLPTPEDVQTYMDEAWGFDYYQPPQLLLLRFDQEWDDRYIQGTVRHTTFRPVAYDRVGRLIQQNLQGKPQEQLLQVWQSRSSKDAYYQAWYRQDDPNVRQRLRAWRPRVEVFLPWSLRQRTAREIWQEQQLYTDIFEHDFTEHDTTDSTV